MKKVIFLLLFLPFMFSSCSKEEDAVDVRDDYVGTYNTSTIGSMSLINNGEVLTTLPLDETTTDVVTKQGTDGLDIGGLSATVAGSKLIIDTQTQTQTADGVTSQMTITFTGTVTKGLITITSKYTGNWSASGATGLITGSATSTFTKK